MGNEDPRITTMRQQLGRLETVKARANADYMQALENGDDDSACMAAQEYANADQERVNLLNTAQRIAYSEQAAVPRQPSREELNNMRLEDMTEPQREWWFSQQSKHGFDRDGYLAGKIHVANNPTRGR
jgi:hypothetical protein